MCLDTFSLIPSKDGPNVPNRIEVEVPRLVSYQKKKEKKKEGPEMELYQKAFFFLQVHLTPPPPQG